MLFESMCLGSCIEGKCSRSRAEDKEFMGVDRDALMQVLKLDISR